jgi:hypothetical protein
LTQDADGSVSGSITISTFRLRVEYEAGIGNGMNDATGAFSAVYPIPPDTPGGSHSVTVSSLDINGDPVTAVAYFSIDDNGTVTAISYDAPTPDPSVAPTDVAAVAVPTFTG